MDTNGWFVKVVHVRFLLSNVSSLSLVYDEREKSDGRAIAPLGYECSMLEYNCLLWMILVLDKNKLEVGLSL